MTLNHIDLQVADVQQNALFFERHFGFALKTSRTSPAIAILEGDGGFVLVLQRRKTDAPYPEGFHIGFLVERDELVHEFHARASAEGLQLSPVERNSRGLMTYCRTSDFVVEVSCRVR